MNSLRFKEGASICFGGKAPERVLMLHERVLVGELSIKVVGLVVRGCA